MNNLVYYPGFEVQDEKWLKFALLYLERIHPIIPRRGMSYLGEKTKFIMNNTDLIEPYDPTYHHLEGEDASQKALNLFDDYLKNPERYISNHGLDRKIARGFRIERANMLLDKWRTKSNQNYSLFYEKFSWAFQNYCIENKLAYESDYGIINISKDLAYVYMSFLADEISDKKGMDSITDHSLSNRLLLRKDSLVDKKLKIIERSINVEIPSGIKNISLEKIVELRNDPHFREIRKIYMEEVNKYLDDNMHTGTDWLDNNTLLDCSAEIRSILYDFFKVALSVTAITLYTKDLIVGISLGSGISFAQEVLSANDDGKGILNSAKKIHNKRTAKKYLAKIKKL